jgi:hypothetical protein
METEILKGRDFFEEPCINGMIILKWVTKKFGIWLWNTIMNLCIPCGIIWPTEQLSASQEGPCFMKVIG